jgi:MOSC domain-containing protein YiiM
LFAGVARVVSVNVGRVEAFPDWTSAFVKEPIPGRVRIGPLGLEGDEHADGVNHGGLERAVLMYAETHYPQWREELSLEELPFGSFAENLTVRGLTEAVVCVGDSLRVGGAVLQVSGPRAPCWKIGRRWEIDDLTQRVSLTTRIGWLLRVVEEGDVGVGDPVELLERPYPELTVAHAYAVYSRRAGGVAAAAELAACPLLTPTWREALGARR